MRSPEVKKGQIFKNRDIPTKPGHNLRNYDSYEKTELRFSIPLEILYRHCVTRFDLRTKMFAPEVIEIEKPQYWEKMILLIKFYLRYRAGFDTIVFLVKIRFN